MIQEFNKTKTHSESKNHTETKDDDDDKDSHSQFPILPIPDAKFKGEWEYTDLLGTSQITKKHIIDDTIFEFKDNRIINKIKQTESNPKYERLGNLSKELCPTQTLDDGYCKYTHIWKVESGQIRVREIEPVLRNWCDINFDIVNGKLKIEKNSCMIRNNEYTKK